ncbi:hypothetical protein M3202_21585 [Alkalihalobacillus oceani]|uniref:Uncharacterized protein n=1 Tax=Halalkalibacter oceani TaxID=1653776 RepID=A0A9X2DWP5_9BACI|nr:hypothetical protein [Halalkalibacter oceani]MCM3716638.1 hypothetical protein [Halalkalibacter oceani]
MSNNLLQEQKPWIEQTAIIKKSIKEFKALIVIEDEDDDLFSPHLSAEQFYNKTRNAKIKQAIRSLQEQLKHVSQCRGDYVANLDWMQSIPLSETEKSLFIDIYQEQKKASELQQKYNKDGKRLMNDYRKVYKRIVEYLMKTTNI